MIQCPAGEPIMRSYPAGALKAMNEKDERMESVETAGTTLFESQTTGSSTV